MCPAGPQLRGPIRRASSRRVRAPDPTGRDRIFRVRRRLPVTAHHVIAGLTDIKVVMSPRQVLRARTVKIDKASDLALLKVDAITPFVYLSHSNGVPAGMDVITMGYPQVSVLGITTKVTRGIVNSERGMRDDPTSFQFSAEVQKGELRRAR